MAFFRALRGDWKPPSSYLLSKAVGDLFTLTKEAVEKKVMSLQMVTLMVDSWEVPVLGASSGEESWRFPPLPAIKINFTRRPVKIQPGCRETSVATRSLGVLEESGEREAAWLQVT